MRLLILSFLVLVGGALFAHFVRRDPGYVLIGFGHYSIEMSLALFIVLALVLIFTSYYVLRLLGVIGRTPKQMKKWSSKRKEKSAHKSLNKGLLAQAEGKWHNAERALVTQADSSSNPVLNYLAAARAANEQGATERVDRYLRLAHAKAPKDDIVVDLTKIELLLENEDDEAALALILSLRRKHQKNPRLLGLLAQTYQRLEDWKSIVDILPELRRRRALELDQFLKLEKATYQGLLSNALDNGSADKLREAWRLIPKHWQQDSLFLAPYVEGLIALNESSMTEALLRDAINRKWDPVLVELYGALEGVNHAKQMDVAERWLDMHRDDAALLYTLGRICMQRKLWGKARSYIESSIALEPRADKYQTLAQLLEETGETESAAECYRKGLGLLASRALPAPILPTRPTENAA